MIGYGLRLKSRMITYFAMQKPHSLWVAGVVANVPVWLEEAGEPKLAGVGSQFMHREIDYLRWNLASGG